ncbi:hypothetical protein GYMLUDRAFT_49225 [Collybiopsis luxurians FD-317 M1]|uniref:Aldehyde dehydrogenase domain-containing protein n=1 Tax=Collybiopsis luxurians FD-317 M1 TaxID=944289 RepID=A0A0D0BVI2_9AGAR|nr:hypothetical protein GYMLUDRAFT_49225 [Collybiopsis luxurians FD-317 M1]
MFRCSGYGGPMIEPTYLISPIPSICFINDRTLLPLRLFVVFDTGNGIIAQIIATAAANQLAPLTLELWGKSPVTVNPKCDLELAAKRTMWGKVTNCGQCETEYLLRCLPYILFPFHPPRPNLLLMTE